MAGDSSACVSSVAAETIEDSAEGSQPAGGSSSQQVEIAVREKASVWEEHPKLRDEVSLAVYTTKKFGVSYRGFQTIFRNRIREATWLRFLRVGNFYWKSSHPEPERSRSSAVSVKIIQSAVLVPRKAEFRGAITLRFPSVSVVLIIREEDSKCFIPGCLLK